jgi:hypothetical protein
VTATATRTATPTTTATPTRTATAPSHGDRDRHAATDDHRDAGRRRWGRVRGRDDDPGGGRDVRGDDERGEHARGDVRDEQHGARTGLRVDAGDVGAAQVSTCSGSGTSYDTVVYVRSGSCTAGAEVACNDDATGCFTSEPNDHMRRGSP